MTSHRPARAPSQPMALRGAATAALAAFVLMLGAPACSQPPAPSGSPGPGPGAGRGGPWGMGRMGAQSMDQHFIVMMIPHHDGAIAMADLALSRAKRPEIKELARSIKASQTSENAQMRTWYRQWFGQPVPTWNQWAGGGMGMGHIGEAMGMGPMGGGMGMGPMGGGTDLTILRTAPDFDRAFIEQMIPHHQMGVRMALMAQVNSQHPELRTLQQAMVKAQSQEIEQMRQWYRRWYGSP